MNRNPISDVKENKYITIQAGVTNYSEAIGPDGTIEGTFTIGGVLAKCFGWNCANAAIAAERSKERLFKGEFRTVDGRPEFLVHDISSALPELDSQQSKSEFTSVQRTSSTTLETIEGKLSDVSQVPTRPGCKHMITFRIGDVFCKAFGEPAEFLENRPGELITVLARRGTYRGKSECVIKAVKSVNGDKVDLWDKYVKPSPSTEAVFQKCK